MTRDEVIERLRRMANDRAAMARDATSGYEKGLYAGWRDGMAYAAELVQRIEDPK